MLAANTLMALACLIGNKGSIDTSAVENQLSPDEKVQVQKYIDAGACLPQSLEQRVKDTEEKILRGEMKSFSAHGSPTFECD
jgi:hypothetical protein